MRTRPYSTTVSYTHLDVYKRQLKARGILPGRDISVMGYDDIEWATQIYPTLSTVRADAGKLGSEAVNLMVRLIDGKQVESKILPTEFIRRDSFCKKGGSRKRSKNVIEGYLSMNHMQMCIRDRYASHEYY